MILTNAAGRFRVAALPAGRYRVRATHAAFDSAGLWDGVAAEVRLPAAEPLAEVPAGVRPVSVPPVVLRLAGPSAATLAAQLCGGAPAEVPAAPEAPRRTVVLYGAVRDAVAGAPRPGALVQAAWFGVRPLDVPGAADAPRAGTLTAQVQSDDAGRWAVCLHGAHAELDDFTVQVLAARTATTADSTAEGAPAGALTDPVRVQVGAEGVRRIDLLAAPEDTILLAVPPAGPTPPAREPTTAPPPVVMGAAPAPVSGRLSAVLRWLPGVVRDSAGSPVRGAVVTLGEAAGGPDAPDGTRDAVRTDSLGRFRLPVRRLGTRVLRVRALGYAPYAAPLAAGARTPAAVDVTLARVALLSAVEVRARAGSLLVRRALEDIDYRRTRGLVRTLDSTEVVRWGGAVKALRASGVPLLPPNIPVARGRFGRPLCVAVNGGLMPDASFPLPTDVAVAEYFDSPSDGQPLELQAKCGTQNPRLLIVWTKQFLTARPDIPAPRTTPAPPFPPDDASPASASPLGVEAPVLPAPVPLAAQTISRPPSIAAPVRWLPGAVRDSAGAPVRDAVVTLGDAPDLARTDSLGRFRVPVRRLGTQVLRVRALGYAPHAEPVAVGARTPASADVTLARVALLSAVEVRARGGAAWLRRTLEDIDYRQRRGLVRAADSAAFARWNNTRAVLDNLGGGLRTRPAPGGDFVLQGPLKRPVCVVLNGLREDQSALMLPPASVAVVEYFASPSDGQPLEHQARCGMQNQGMLLVWTKDYLDAGRRSRR